MRKNNRPTEEQLRRLYEAALAFKQKQLWNSLYDADIVCVKNPKNKRMGFCSVMGKAGEHFALGVYLGTEGLWGFLQIMEQGNKMSDYQMLQYQDCLMCSFEDRNILTNKDRSQIKSLGLSFRGKNAWPMFRRFEPGYYPWYINKEECDFLTLALEQILFAADDISTGKYKMDMAQGKTILRYQEEKNGKQEWRSKEIQLDFPTVTYQFVTITDDRPMKEVKKAGKMIDISLQADTCYLYAPIQESKEERPYFPRIFVLIDTKSKQVLGYDMYDSIHQDAQTTLDKLIGFCAQFGVPKEIQIRNEKMQAILHDFCSKMGIRLKMAENLPDIDHFIKKMERMVK